MANSQFIASVHKDYLPFVSLATDEELAQFVRAQISQSNGEDVPQLTGMAKALFDAHAALIERLEESSRKKSEAGKRGGNPAVKQSSPVVNQCLTTDKTEVKQAKAEVKPVTDTVPLPAPEDIPPLPPQGGKSRKKEVQEIWGSYTFSPPISVALKSWGKYKREKRQEYKPEGLKSLLSQVQTNVEKYGEEAVIALISESMAANWQGIAWDKLARIPDVRGSPKSNKPPGGASYDLAELEEMLNKDIG